MGTKLRDATQGDKISDAVRKAIDEFLITEELIDGSRGSFVAFKRLI